MKIFLTGSTGFIGSHFINAAHNEGHDLVCLKRNNSSAKINLNKEPKWVFGDLDSQLTNEFVGCEAFVHLASHSTNPPYDNVINCVYWNVIKSIEFAEQARNAGVKKFLIIGSGFEYGNSSKKFDFIPVDAPLEPLDAYSVSKAMSFLGFKQWAIENNIYLNYLRLFHVYGDGESPDRLWPTIQKSAEKGLDIDLTLGEQIRDFTPVDIVIRKLLKCLEFTNVKKGMPNVENVGSGKPEKLKTFVERSWSDLNATGAINFGARAYRANEIMRFVPEIKK